MSNVEVLSNILAEIKISTENLKKYDVDPEKVHSLRILTDNDTHIPSAIIRLGPKVNVPFLGVNSDYFDRYLEKLKGSNIHYRLFEIPYRYIILKGAKFAIRDDVSYNNWSPKFLEF